MPFDKAAALTERVEGELIFVFKILIGWIPTNWLKTGEATPNFFTSVFDPSVFCAEATEPKPKLEATVAPSTLSAPTLR